MQNQHPILINTPLLRPSPSRSAAVQYDERAFSRANGIAMGTEYADQKQRERQDLSETDNNRRHATPPQ